MAFFEADLLDRHGYGDSVIHRLDPRAKLLATLGFIITVVSFPKYEIAALLPFALFPLALGILGFVPLKLLMRQMLPALPFIFLVGIFNPLLDTRPVLIFDRITIHAGWLSFGSIILRGLYAVSAGLILIATTSFPRIIQALCGLGAPRVFTVQLTLLYRYLFLLLGEAGLMRNAAALRSPGKKITLHTAQAMLGSLLSRTLDRAEAIWLAMRARGFDGELFTSFQMRWRLADSLFLAGMIFLLFTLRLFSLPVLLARLGGLL
jgi:cobalt/nickel transport system permease protein